MKTDYTLYYYLQAIAVHRYSALVPQWYRLVLKYNQGTTYIGLKLFTMMLHRRS